MNTQTDTLRTLQLAANKYLDEARESGLTPTDTGPIRGAVDDTFSALRTYHETRASIQGDPYLNEDGKRARLTKVETDAREAATKNAERARGYLEQSRKAYERRAQLPRLEGADLTNARHDVDRLTAGVPAGRLAERLEFAVKNGGGAVADLLLGDNYAERVIFPAAGDTYKGDAASWAGTKRRLVAERLGPDAARYLRGLEATPTAEKAVTIAAHAAQTTFPAESAGGSEGDPA